MKVTTLIYRTLISIYNILPFKKHICLLLRALPLNNEKYYRDLTFNAPFTVRLGSNTFKLSHCMATIENRMFWKGISGWEKVSFSLWLQLCSRSAVIFDVGANTGIYSLAAASINTEAQIFSFEPSPKIFEYLERNIELNNFKNIRHYQAALSNHSGTAVLYDFNTEHHYSASLNKNMFGDEVVRNEIKVIVKSLDDFIVENSLKQIDLIKLDVEMHEPKVLNGFSIFLPRFRPTLLIEVLNEEIANQISSLIGHLDYVYFDIKEETGPTQISKIQKSSGYNLLICRKNIAIELGLFR